MIIMMMMRRIINVYANCNSSRHYYKTNMIVSFSTSKINITHDVDDVDDVDDDDDDDIIQDDNDIEIDRYKHGRGGNERKGNYFYYYYHYYHRYHHYHHRL